MTVAELSEAASRPAARTADLTVVGGAGHVGIPLVLSFAAKGLTVNVNDLNEQTLATLKSRSNSAMLPTLAPRKV